MVERSGDIAAELGCSVRCVKVGTDGGCSLQGVDGWAAGGQVGRQYVEGFDDLGTAGRGCCALAVLGSLGCDEGDDCCDRESRDEELGAEGCGNDAGQEG